MTNTKSKKKQLRHYEVEIRTVMQDSLSFISYLIEKKHYKLRNPLNLLFRLTVAAVMYLSACIVSLAIYKLGIDEWIRIAFSVITGIIIVRVFLLLRPRYKNIRTEELMEYVADSTLPPEEKKEKIAFYNFGEEGFSTNSYYNQTETVFHRYKDLARAIEFEKGIVLIYQDKSIGTRIYCVPTRFFNEDAEDFLLDRLKKKMGRRYRYEDSMVNLMDEDGNFIL